MAGLLKSGAGLVLTDYIIDEACPLVKARGRGYGAMVLLEILDRS